MARFKFPFRLVLSVIAGIVTAGALTILTNKILHWLDVFPPFEEPMSDAMLIADLSYHSFYAIIGAIVTAHIARDKARKAVFILGSKEAIMWFLGMLLLWNYQPLWVNIAKSVLGPGLAWIGGRLYHRFKNGKK